MKNLVRRGLRVVPDESFERLLNLVLEEVARSRDAERALRLLLKVDAHLYALQGRLATVYGGGVHTKHRHIGYHDFFTSRIDAGERVLDVGCGVGALAVDIAARTSANVVGVDVDAANLEQARSAHSHPLVEYRLADATRELRAGTFDVVVLSNVLEHVEHRVEFLRRLASETRCLRILVRVPLLERDWRVPLRKELGVDWRLDPGHFIEYTDSGFHDEVSRAGFEVTSEQVRWGEIWAELRTVPRMPTDAAPVPEKRA